MKSTIFVVCSFALVLSQPLMAKPDHEKSLPPGLAKKVESGKPLPPGWQKKLSAGQYLADDYYRRGTVLSKPNADGIITVQIEGTIIELFEHSREIVRILEGKR
ncbi:MULTISPECIES: hypothetical protein [unclassified Arsukibacterium]|uniref:hypothetical protein n=1 Tax=unclassified Arsukibacterium TaxID=2635278 RepID=UPI000C98D41F|nr:MULTISPECIES: hypothetical protein [unclassified Arsukibacterium]MAA95480.1 hypothetical protein [Rheinheimera sp.]HAW94380.1 hypothetical protein [Candidatus Azambacteria bacterium]|tara:strand:- start:20945 stop:21256 length:312 start_codon:yes stop_codon:yes gene_type:complete